MAATGTHIPHWGGMHDVTHLTAHEAHSRDALNSHDDLWHSLQWILRLELRDAPQVRHGSHRYGWTDVPGTLKCLCMKQLHPVHKLQKFSINIQGLFGLPGNSLWWVSNFIYRTYFSSFSMKSEVADKSDWFFHQKNPPTHSLLFGQGLIP